MNNLIPQLLRAQFAFNKAIASTDVNTRDVARTCHNEFSMPLVNPTTGKACQNNYVKELFADLLDKTGVDITNPTSDSNKRKRLLGIFSTKPTYRPSHEVQEAVAEYVGADSWDELEDLDIAQSILDEILANLHLRMETSSKKSVSKQALSPSTVKRNDILVLFTTKGKTELESLGDSRFKVLRTANKNLDRCDVLTLRDTIVKGNRIFAHSHLHFAHEVGPFIASDAVMDFEVKDEMLSGIFE